MRTITVIGTGYVGLVSGAGISDFGHRVICADIQVEKINDLINGVIPIYEPGLEELVIRNTAAGRLSFTADIPNAIKKADVVYIAVGTPESKSGEADMTAVWAVAKTIAKNLNDYKVICTKSTVTIGTGKKICEIIDKHRDPNVDYDYVSNPEFLREGAAVEDFTHPDRVIIGSTSERAFEIMKDVFRPLYVNETPIIHTNIQTAEMIKYASNAYLALKISYINEIANLCENVDADVHVVAKAMGIDGRISPKFLHPGPGFGGSCFPKDTKALAYTAGKLNSPLRTINAAIETNIAQKKRMVKKLKVLMDGSFKGKLIAVLGLSFKPQTNDIRESPAVDMIEALLNEGAVVKAYDPVAMDEMRLKFPDIQYLNTWEAAVEASQAMAIMTDWNEFRGLNISKLKELMAQPVVLDTRNVLSMEELQYHGFRYDNVGRKGKSSG